MIGIPSHTMPQLAPPSFKEVNAYYGIMLNSVLTARLILNLRQATPGNNNSRTTLQNGRWDSRTMNKLADDFDDAPRSDEIYMMDTVRRLRAQT